MTADDPLSPPLLTVRGRLPSFEQVLLDLEVPQRNRAALRNERVIRDVTGHKLHRAESAGEWQLRQGRGQGEPRANADARVSALETTAGSPHSRAIASADCTPPSGATFTTMTSAASSRTTRIGSEARLIDSSAATKTSMPLCAMATRSNASSSTLAHGCSAYSSSYASSLPNASVASATVQPPLASTRIRARGPIASRTAATRDTSSSSR